MARFNAKAHSAAIERYRLEIDTAMAQGEYGWYRFFNGARDGVVAFRKGKGAWRQHFQPWIDLYLPEPWGTALEIGYGGGVLLAQAAKRFDAVIGVDIHKHTDFVARTVHRKGGKEPRLLQTNGRRSLKGVQSGSVACVYSWCTFMHLYSQTVARGYLKDIQRVLQPSGVAVIYTARLCCSGPTQEYWQADVVQEGKEAVSFRELGYDIAPNLCNLQLSVPWAQACARKLGLDLVAVTVSRKPDGKTCGGQHGFVFKKPEPVEEEAE
jgi:SAM-dependent methyltransferase